MFYSHAFGHNGELAFHGLGINGKISELQAATGLALFPYLPEILAARKKVIDFMISIWILQDCRNWKSGNIQNGIMLTILYFLKQKHIWQTHWSEWMHWIFSQEDILSFLNTLPYVDAKVMEISESTAARILCLPLYTDLREAELETIISFLKWKHEQNTQGGGSFDYSIDVAHEFAPDRTSHVLLFFLVFFRVYFWVSVVLICICIFINQNIIRGQSMIPIIYQNSDPYVSRRRRNT